MRPPRRMGETTPNGHDARIQVRFAETPHRRTASVAPRRGARPCARRAGWQDDNRVNMTPPTESALPRRSTPRLPGYDYGQAGAYFVTSCSYDRELLFGRIEDDGVLLNQYGQIVQEEWLRTAEIRREVRLDEFVVMPNHLHGIVFIDDVVPATRRAHGRAPLRRGPRSLGSLIAGFKSAATKRINAARRTPRASVWQRNYYEHVMRDERDLSRVREYIVNNPLKWALDENNPANLNRPVGAHGRAPAAPHG